MVAEMDIVPVTACHCMCVFITISYHNHKFIITVKCMTSYTM